MCSYQHRLAPAQSIPLLAIVMALSAFSIDTMLPALSTIAQELGAHHQNDAQLVIVMMFVGFSAGQLLYGPLSDIIGRKRALYLGISVFIVGCTISYQAANFQAMLVGRFLQGLGVSSARIVSLAIVRDQYVGADMAKIMSMIMGVFIIVPALAPSLGQLVLNWAGYRAIFLLFLIHAIIAVAWLGLRQPETLTIENRKRFDLGTIWNDVRYVVGEKSTVFFTLAQGFVFGNFVAFLSSAPQVFADLYQEKERFPLIFGGLVTSIGLASVLNSRLVKRLGMLRLASLGLIIMSSFSLSFLVFIFLRQGHPPLWVTLFFFGCIFFQVGFLMGNLNTMAMRSMGERAGTAAAVIGAISTLISLTCGAVIGQSYQRTIVPLIIGFFLLSTLALIATRLGAVSCVDET
ncbi:MAG: multidrug effflux MFS transporter [Candidatus Poribacteria bacterium]|nr:multidrug effflux MFS transporter [Candidatus Poribacteria bacterium]